MSIKKSTLDLIKNHQSDGISFRAEFMVEIFNAPLMSKCPNGSEIDTAWDLVRMSAHEGFNELFLTNSEVVNGESNGKPLKFSIDDFLRWQLERFSAETLYHLAAKTEASIASSCNTNFEPKEKLLNYDDEIEKDPDYDPDEWLNENNTDPEIKQKGLALIERLRKEKPNEFYKLIINGILDKQVGVLTWLETEIDDDLSDVRDSYAHWPVPLIVVSEGDFLPYIDFENMSNLMMDTMQLNRMYIRNYDEDEKA